jgi:undecaprenyl-diphosphatase
MNPLDALMLGVLQGFTEWLPISSSGHLVIVQTALNMDPTKNVLFDVIVHFGTLLAVCVYFSKELGRIIISMLSRKASRDPQADKLRTLGFLLLIGTIPAGLAGVFLESPIEKLFTGRVVALGLVANGFLLLGYVKFGSNGSRKDARLLDAIVVGVFQAFSIIPGISRSGSTIGGGMLRGLEKETAAVFAFLLAVPTLVGAVAFGAVTLPDHNIGLVSALTGFASSFAVGLLTIPYLFRTIRKGKFWMFGVYCIAIGTLATIFLF